MTVLNDYLKYHLPSKEAAKVHVRLVIKNYSQMDINTYRRQMGITERGLFVSGFTKEQAREIMLEAIKEDN